MRSDLLEDVFRLDATNTALPIPRSGSKKDQDKQATEGEEADCGDTTGDSCGPPDPDLTVGC